MMSDLKRIIAEQSKISNLVEIIKKLTLNENNFSLSCTIGETKGSYIVTPSTFHG